MTDLMIDLLIDSLLFVIETFEKNYRVSLFLSLSLSLYIYLYNYLIIVILCGSIMSGWRRVCVCVCVCVCVRVWIWRPGEASKNSVLLRMTDSERLTD